MQTIKKIALFFAIVIFFVDDGMAQLDSNEIKDIYSSAAEKIIAAALSDTAAFQRLVYLCDTFGPRFSGTQNLEDALNWIAGEMRRDNFDSVWKEPVMIPNWVRGNEYLKLITPGERFLRLSGICPSVGTPAEGITAPLLVVRNFGELKEKADEAKGKIVLFSEPWKNYGQAVQYRYWGAVRAAEVGAVASLCRSATPRADANPHTGSMSYRDAPIKIPHAAISIEDAEMLQRIYLRGQNPVIQIYMEAENRPEVESANLICEIRGWERPDEIIAIGGHLDSWDLSHSAHDDAAGCVATWEAVNLLKNLGLRPRRTIRAVMFADEEISQAGAKAYKEAHQHEKHILMLEFDSGVFPPSEMLYKGNDTAFTQIQAFSPLLNLISPIVVKPGQWVGVDIAPMVNIGVPGITLNTDDGESEYMWYHHSATDTIDKIKIDDFNKCVAAIALVIYLYADLPYELEGQNTITPQGGTR